MLDRGLPRGHYVEVESRSPSSNAAIKGSKNAYSTSTEFGLSTWRFDNSAAVGLRPNAEIDMAAKAVPTTATAVVTTMTTTSRSTAKSAHCFTAMD